MLPLRRLPPTGAGQLAALPFHGRHARDVHPVLVKGGVHLDLVQHLVVGVHVGEVHVGNPELLRQTFKPEFLNRVDDVIIFRPLSHDDIAKIVEIQSDLTRKLLLVVVQAKGEKPKS